jgi:hypothetical protein
MSGSQFQMKVMVVIFEWRHEWNTGIVKQHPAHTLFCSPFQLGLRFRKQWRAGTGFTAAMAERTCCPASVAVAFLYLL